MVHPAPKPIVQVQEFHRRWRQNPSTYLLVALLLLLFAYPFFVDDSFQHRLVLGVFNVVILLAAAYAAVERLRTFLVVLLFLGVPALVLEADYLLTKSIFVSYLLALTYATFYGFTIGHVLRYVLAPGIVTTDKICGAIASYILIALLWSTLYMLVDRVYPGSFSYNGNSDEARLLMPVDFIYFSFTTLTTTGYGDVVPRLTHARALAILEQLAGTFYIAILIARLTGLYQSGANDRPEKD